VQTRWGARDDCGVFQLFAENGAGRAGCFGHQPDGGSAHAVLGDEHGLHRQQSPSGATRSKAIYRVIGTTIGAAAAVAMVPAMVEAPALLSLALSLWVGAVWRSLCWTAARAPMC
jgi:hypothetical protein